MVRNEKGGGKKSLLETFFGKTYIISIRDIAFLFLFNTQKVYFEQVGKSRK